MSINLQYDYAQIEPSTGLCISVFTSSYEIPIPEEYILIPMLISDYMGKYYHEGLWYIDPEFAVLAEGLN